MADSNMSRRPSKEAAERAGTSKKATAKSGPHAGPILSGVDPETGTVRPAGKPNQRLPKPAPVGPTESKTAIETPDQGGSMRPVAGGSMSAAIMKPTRSNPARKI